jgi:hypothetical protein
MADEIKVVHYRPGSPSHQSVCKHGNWGGISCADCIIEDTLANRYVHRGTGNEADKPLTPYTYLNRLREVEAQEDQHYRELLRELDQETQGDRSSSPPTPKDSVEVLMPTPRPIAEAVAEAKVIPDLCSHGGIILNGITYCGVCQKDNTRAMAAHIMYMDLMRICEQEGKRRFYHRVSNEDQVQHAFEAVWSKLAKVVAANNPPALARTIARQAVSDLRKKADNWKLVPVSDGTEPNGDRSGSAVTPSANYDGDDKGDNGWLEMEDFKIKYQGGPGQIGTTDWSIPGGERFWVPPAYRKMEIALTKAMAALPRPPQHRVPMAVDMMIKRWVGYFPEIGEQSYDTIGQICNPVTDARRVKYLIQKGIRQARTHILQITGDAAREERGM